MYIDDLLRWRNFYEINEKLKNGEFTLRDLIDIDNDSIETLVSNLNCLENVNLDDLVNSFIYANAEAIVLFASNATCLTEHHIETLVDFIIKTGDIDSMIEFASNVSNSSINKLGKKIIESKDNEKIIEFLENVSNISNELMDDFARTIVATKDIDAIKNFLEAFQNIYGSTYEILVSGLITINDVDNMISFIEKANDCHRIIPKATLKTLLNSIIAALKEEKTQLNKFENIYQYVINNYSKGIQMEIFEDLTNKVILTQKMDFIVYFAINFEGANKDKIAKTLIAYNSYKWVYIFAKNVKNIPEDVMNRVVDFVRKTYSPEFIYLFLCNFVLSRINLLTLVFAIMKTGNIDYIGFALLNVGNKYLQGDLKMKLRMEEIKKAKTILKDYLDKNGNCLDKDANYSFLTYPITNPCDELEEKLLNSDDSNENPFVPIADAKTMNFVKP